MKEKEYYEKIKKWDFNDFSIESEELTDWNLYEMLEKLANDDSRILDLGTGGGEKLLAFYPKCLEIVGTDYSEKMIETAKKNLERSGRCDVKFSVMNNLEMDVLDDYFDIVVARHTITDPKQIYKCLKKGGYLLIQGVDKADCWSLKMKFKRGQGYDDFKPLSLVDYENVLDAGFRDVELVPLHVREYFNDEKSFKRFLNTVPIINDFSNEDCCKLDDDLLDEYIVENTYNGKILLLRRYYGIVAKK